MRYLPPGILGLDRAFALNGKHDCSGFGGAHRTAFFTGNNSNAHTCSVSHICESFQVIVQYINSTLYISLSLLALTALYSFSSGVHHRGSKCIRQYGKERLRSFSNLTRTSKLQLLQTCPHHRHLHPYHRPPTKQVPLLEECQPQPGLVAHAFWALKAPTATFSSRNGPL